MNAAEGIARADRSRLADCAVELGEIVVSLKEFAHENKDDPTLAVAASLAQAAGEAANGAFMLAALALDSVPIKTWTTSDVGPSPHGSVPGYSTNQPSNP